MPRPRLLPVTLVIALSGWASHPRAQAPPAAAAFYAVGDLPGGGATTIIRDATQSGGVIYAVGGAVTRQSFCGAPQNAPCTGTDTPILWRFDSQLPVIEGINPTLEALPDIDPNGSVFLNNGASDITSDGRYVASQARKAVTGGFGGFARRPVRVDTSLLPSPSANLDLNTTFSPALTVIDAAAVATSHDGTIVYGNGPGLPRAIRFDTTGLTSLFIPLLGLDTQNNVTARGVSTDGTVVVGGSFGAGVSHAYRYEHGSGVAAIPMLPGGTFNSALAVSPDGDLVLVSGNTATNPTKPEAYLWRASTNAIQPLGSPNAAFRTGGRLCANGICNGTIQIQGGMTADGSVVAMNFTTPPPTVESGHAYFHNANGWFHLASVLGANGVYLLADGWQNLVITGMSSDGTLVFGAGEHNGVVEGFVAEFGAGVLANFNPQAAPPVSTALVGTWVLCEVVDEDCDVNGLNGPVNSIVVFTAQGAYYVIEESGFERGLYTFDGNALTITTLLDTSGSDGASYLNGTLLGPVVVAGDAIMPGGPLEGIRFAGSIAEPLVGAWVNGDPTLPGSSFVTVLLGSDRGYRIFQANDNPLFGGGVGSELGTYTWNPDTHQLDITPDGGTPDVGNFATPAPDGLTIHVLGDDGDEFDVARVIDPATIPVIANTPLSESGVVGQPFSYDVDATNATTFTATGLPGGLSIDSITGVISGTPGVGGQFTVTITATSAIGVSDIETFSLTIARAPTSAALASSLNPATYGQAITLTATVTSTAGVPTGSVTFADGGATLGTVAVDGSGQAALVVNLPAGGHGLTATYGGDSSFNGSTGDLSESVATATTSTTLASSPNPSSPGQPVNFVATVTGQYGGAVTGLVTFKKGPNTIGTAAVAANGTATLTLANLGTGPHVVTATYAGDSNSLASTSSSVTQNVVAPAAPTTTNVSSSVNPSVVGQQVTFTAVVTSGSPGTPTGTITFRRGQTPLATVPMSGATATYSISTLPAGSLGITAVYSGDAQFITSTSASLTQVVNKASTTTTLGSTPNPSNLNEGVTFTATVVTSTGATATGSVALKEGSTTIVTTTLNASGVATFNISTLSRGKHNLKAVYAGDASNTNSTSNTYQQTVQ